MAEELLHSLNKEQQQAVTHQDGPLLIIAGAGTGKTTVVTQRIAWLIREKKVSPDDILALTFTEKAAQEMEERVESLLPIGYVDLWISTFHAFCERVLHDYALDIGLPPQFTLAAEYEQWMLLKKHIDELDLDYYKPLGNPTKFLQELLRHFSRCKDEDIWPDDYLRYAEEIMLNTDSVSGQKPSKNNLGIKESDIPDASRIQELARVYNTYQQLLLKQGCLDFGDLILYTLKLFRTRPKILEIFQKQFKYILVDEFQDTNYAQYELIKILSRPKNNVVVVADDDQSIYKFRGASISNVVQFKKNYPQSKQIALIQNYRSKQNILDLAYAFIQLNNPDRLEKQIGIDKKLKGALGKKGLIEHIHAPSLEREVDEVIKKIISLKNQDSQLLWSDFVILVRANDQANIFIKKFEQNNIPHQFVASRGLYLKPEIIDLFSYLRLLDNYHESRALYRVLNIPLFFVAHDDLIQLLHYAHKNTLSLYETLKICRTIKGITEDAYKNIEKLFHLIEKHTSLVRSGTAVGQILFHFLEDSEILQYYSHLEEKRAVYTMNILKQLFKNIEKFEKATDDQSVRNFLEYINNAIDAGDTGAMGFDVDLGPDTVKIMTIHTAKGLEFPYVFVVNLVDKRFPSVQRKDLIPLPDKLIKEVLNSGDAHLQEERRLFYVACTRAKEGLIFTSAEDYGGSRKKKLSRFLLETGLVEEKFKVSKIAENPLHKVEKTPQKTVPVAMEPSSPQEKLSFTQLKAYETCPYQYRFAHILKVPVKGNHVFSFGKTVHATLQQFFHRILLKKNNNQSSLFSETVHLTSSNSPLVIPSCDELIDMYEHAWIQEWYPSKKISDQYKIKGKTFLKEFYKKHDKRWPSVLHVEQGFTLQIHNFFIKGFIDRIDDLGSGCVGIVDYKTGSVPKKPKKENEQLLLYAMAVSDVLRTKAKTVSYYYIESNTQHDYEVTQQALDSVRRWAAELVQKIQSHDYAATPGFHCQFCDFRDICEFRKNV